ncbi:MAG: CotH kinase family protein, partial [Bacteroidales bacterium]|nr:CotH kinase family protein [Bacteroidales bacterium]
VDSTNISISENYNQLCEKIDVNCFIDYIIFEIFISNYDWPTNNMRCWQDGDGPWRWIFFDGDGAFGNPYYDSFRHATDTSDNDWPTNKRSTLMFRKLLTNRTFCRNFSDRFHELYGSSFQYDNTATYKDQIINKISTEIQNQINRFNYPQSYESWTDALSNIDTFLICRPAKIIDDLENFIPMSIMQNMAKSEIKCFPNPTADFINISISNTQWGLSRIAIFDQQGKNVYSDIVYCDEGENIFTVDLQNFPQGTYIVKVGETTQKVVKIR